MLTSNLRRTCIQSDTKSMPIRQPTQFIKSQTETPELISLIISMRI